MESIRPVDIGQAVEVCASGIGRLDKTFNYGRSGTTEKTDGYSRAPSNCVAVL